jgi:hypothetical protein
MCKIKKKVIPQKEEKREKVGNRKMVNFRLLKNMSEVCIYIFIYAKSGKGERGREGRKKRTKYE